MQSTIVNDVEATRNSLVAKYKEDDEKMSSRLKEIMKESNKLHIERHRLEEMAMVEYAKLCGFLELADKIDINNLDKTFKQMESAIEITDETYAERMMLKNAYDYAFRQLNQNGNALVKRIEDAISKVSDGYDVYWAIVRMMTPESVRMVLRGAGMSDEEIRVGFTFWRMNTWHENDVFNDLAEGK